MRRNVYIIYAKCPDQGAIPPPLRRSSSIDTLILISRHSFINVSFFLTFPFPAISRCLAEIVGSSLPIFPPVSNLKMASSGMLNFANLSPVNGQNTVNLRPQSLGVVILKNPVPFRLAGMCSYKNGRQFVVVSMLQPGGDLQSGASSIIVSNEDVNISIGKDVRDLETSAVSKADHEGGGGGGGGIEDGNGGNGKHFGGGGGGQGDGEEGDYEEKEFGPIMKFEEVMKEVEARGATLPSDMLKAAQNGELRQLLLSRYLDLQGSGWPLGFLMRSWAMLRNRMLADPSFLFKIGTEIVIDSVCATFAEVQKRGEDFWSEFELYVADLLVGVVVNIALVGMLAPYARIGQPSVFGGGLLGSFQKMYADLPSSVFEAERPGCNFSVKQRVATYFFKGVLYGAVGFGCGLIGQGIANLIMTAKRNINKSEEDIPVPPLVKSAALWGVFLAVSSNTRYQIINGLERFVEASPLGKKVPPAALAFTVGVRFANNVYGGMQFVDWARWSGVQ